jgi:hypothetical protein
MLALHVVAGPDTGRRHVLPDTEPQLIGRSTEALGSTDPSVSRRHAELTPSGGRWHLRDLRSTHGTWVNGQRIEGRTELRAGDVIRCGDTVLEVHGADAGEPEVAEADPERLRAIGETVATISHGVKNILQGLRSGADAVELALRRGDLAMAREGWPIVARNLDRVSWLVMNMLAYSKDRPLELEEADLGAVVREACELMRSTAERRRVRLEVSVDEPMPPAPIDANAVHQVLLNLLANAVEAAPERTGRVAVRCALDAPRGVFRVSVEDDGAGVPAAHRARLFEAFASTKGQRGTGLGLAVARALVERHGGTLKHRDASPHGTVMTAEFPADHGDPDAERTRGPMPSSAPSTKWDPPVP